MADIKVKTITSRWGGFSISHADALTWANRIRAEGNQPPLTDAPKHSGAIMHTLEDVVEAAGGVGCFPHGSIVSDRPYESYLILTKYEQGKWVRIDGVMQREWYFTEGEDEEIAKQLLKQQGESHASIWLSSI